MGVIKHPSDPFMDAKKSLGLIDVSESPYRETITRRSSAPLMDNRSQHSEHSHAPSGCASSDGTPEPTRKSVSFGGLHVRTYSLTIGDHPCCKQGLPLSLDWSFSEEGSLSIEQYENSRSPRRSREELKISPEDRSELLSEDGTSATELRRAQRKLHRARSCSGKLCERINSSFFQEAEG